MVRRRGSAQAFLDRVLNAPQGDFLTIRSGEPSIKGTTLPGEPIHRLDGDRPVLLTIIADQKPAGHQETPTTACVPENSVAIT